MPLGNLYPRQVCVEGQKEFPNATFIVSKKTTSGVLVFITDLNNDFFIYMDGDTPRFGNLNDVMSAPASGIALGAAVPPSTWDPREVLGSVTLFGSNRVSSSLAVASTKAGVAPAVGLMCNGGTDIFYLYVVNPGYLCMGGEAAWLANTASAPLANRPTAGTLGRVRDGRTLICNDRGYPALVVASSGKGGAVVLATGDHSDAIAMYANNPGSIVFDSYPNWLTWNKS